MDQSLFLYISHLPHPWMLNECAKFLSGIGAWGAIWFFIAIIFFFREEKRDHRFFLPSILATCGSYIVSELVLKNIVVRSRPPGAYLTDYSFPSTHATIAWAMAVVLSSHEPRYRYWFYGLALLISLSRIYLGAHYPLDVLGGALLGVGIGKFADFLEFARQKQKKQHRHTHI
jgi:undecaprenyl-diphosphatase